MARYPRTAPARPPLLAVLLNYATYVVLIAVCVVTLFLAWPTILSRLSGTPPSVPSVPTAAIIVPPPARPVFSAPVVPTASAGEIEATSQAIYQATAAAMFAQPIPNTDMTGDTAPLIHQSIDSAREAAGENVPTAEPIAPAESNDQFGSKPVLVNPQETHECRHGQIWTDAGCKNPTPVGAP